MAILTMVVTITHMITKPLTLDMANLTMLLGMQKVQVQVFITLNIFSPLIDTQEHILNTKVHMISTHKEATLKVHTCKIMQEVIMITEIFLFQRMNNIKEYEKASKLKEEAAERLKVLRRLKKEAEDDLFDLVSSKASISRRTSVVRSPLPTKKPSISSGLATEKRKTSPKSYETVTQGSSINPRTEHEELMSSGQGRGISTPELIRKHLSAELKKDKKMYEMIIGRNIDEDIRNTQAGKSAGVAGWLNTPLFGYAIANHLRRPLYYFYLTPCTPIQLLAVLIEVTLPFAWHCKF
ncbi:hypothetical protein BY996DRAFT_6614826 [Phakopsora pachyrhizi]|nr:hypothetical protein BY996DRAFT_6614826 [Phakopsora pachyrhizi]